MAGCRSEGLNGRVMLQPAAGGACATIGDLADWAVTVTKGSSEAPGYEDEWTANILNLKSWSGTIEGYWKKETDTDSDEIWKWLTEEVNASYEFRMTYFYPNKDDPTRYWYGYAAMTSFNPHPELTGAVRWTGDFIGGDACQTNRGLYHSTCAES